MLHKYLFQPFRHTRFFGYVFLQYSSSKKQSNFQSLPNKKYLCSDNETWSALVPDTFSIRKKLQVAAIFRDNMQFDFL
jgi:hypothetical protein